MPFAITLLDHGADYGGTCIKVVNKDGIELQYFKSEEGYSFEVVEFSDCFQILGVFDLQKKQWMDYQCEPMSAPRLWKEEYFQVVDRMIAYLNKGMQDLLP